MSDLDRNFHGGRGRKLGKGDKPDDAARIQDVYDIFNSCFATVKGQTVYMGGGGFPSGGGGAPGPQGGFGPVGPQGAQGPQGPSGSGTAATATVVSAFGVSTGGNTLGITGTTQGTIVLAGLGAVTLSQATAPGFQATITISVPVQSVQPAVSGIGVSTFGNTAGSTGTTQGTYVLVGGNQITLSQSTDGNGGTVTIVGRDAIFGAGISTGGNTLGTSGTVTGTLVLAGIGNVTLSQSTNASGATISISVATATATANVTAVSAIGVSTGGNTAGNTGTTIGTVVLAGINHITLSQSTAAGSLATISISGQDAIFGAGVSSGGNTSGTTGTVTGTLVLAGGNNVTLSQSTNASGATITFSAANSATVVSGIGVSTGGNTSGNTGTTLGTVVFAGINHITLSQSTAAGSLATISISGQDAIFGAGISTGGNTSGTSGTVTGTLVLAGIGNITLSQSTNAGGATISISGGTAAAVTAVSAIGVSTGGNTSGNTGTTIGTYVLAGGNQITLSQSTAAGSVATVTISGRDAIFGAGVSSGGNTSGTTGTVTGTLVLAGGNNVTLSQSTNASGATITFSAANSATVVSGIGVSTGGNTSGNTGTTLGTVVFAGINHITLSQSTAAGSLATITISGQDAIFGAGISTGGNTSGTSGTVTGTLVLAGIGNITLSQSTNAGGATISISGGTAAAVTAVSAIGVSTGGNTAGNTGTTIGTYVLAGGNNITLSQSTAAGSLATVTISGRDAIFGAGVSTGGNTSGTTGTVTGTLVLAGINNITLSQSTNTAGATISVSGANAVLGLGVSTGGNTSGNTGTTFGTVVLAGGNNITLSQSTAAGSLATITISAANAVFGAGISTGGNTSGTSGTNSGTFVLVGTNGITLSQATGTGGNTVTISGNQGALSLFSPNADWQSNFTVLNATLSLARVTYPQFMTGTRFEVIMDLTGNSNSTGALTMSVGWYTMSGSTASLATSGSRVISWSSGSATTASTIYGGVSGTRFRTLGINVTLSPGDYLVGVHFRTTNNGTWRIFGRQAMSLVGALDANETNVFLDGTSVSSFTTAMPASINVTDTNYARTGGSALRQPGFILAGTI